MDVNGNSFINQLTHRREGAKNTIFLISNAECGRIQYFLIHGSFPTVSRNLSLVHSDYNCFLVLLKSCNVVLTETSVLI